MGVKIELEKNEIGWLVIALDIANDDYHKQIDNISNSKKIKLKEKQELIKDLQKEQFAIQKLRKFFKGL